MAAGESRNPFAGEKWRITWMATWGQDFVDLLGAGYFRFGADGLGQFRFGAVRGHLDCRVAGARLEFSWRGQDARKDACGRGYAEIVGGELRGHFFIHCGDDSAFRAGRPTKQKHTRAASPAFASLADYCPELETWPERWGREARDAQTGQALVEAFAPFLSALSASGLTRRTLLNHRDNVWLLGYELVRLLQYEPELRAAPIAELIGRGVDAEGGPLLFPRISEEEQKSLDATCRKLHAFRQAAST